MIAGTVVQKENGQTVMIYELTDSFYFAVDYNTGFCDINRIYVLPVNTKFKIIKQGINVKQINKKEIPFNKNKLNKVGLPLSTGYLALGSIIRLIDKEDDILIIGRNVVKGYIPYNYVGYNKRKGIILFNTKDIEKVYYSAGNLEQLDKHDMRSFNDEIHNLNHYIKLTTYFLINVGGFAVALFNMRMQFFETGQLTMIYAILVGMLIMYQFNKSKVLTISFVLLMFLVYVLQVFLLV